MWTRVLAFLSFIAGPLWTWAWEFFRTLFYEQGSHMLRPLLGSITLDHIVHYGPGAIFVCLGGYLFWKTRPPRKQDGPGAAVKMSRPRLYIGGDDRYDHFFPLVGVNMQMWGTAGPARLHNMYARLEFNGGTQDFRLWSRRDYRTSANPPSTSELAVYLPVEGVNIWNYFYIYDDTYKTFRFPPGDYKLTLLANDDQGMEFVVTTEHFPISEGDAAHIKTREGIYFTWDTSKQIYIPQRSEHTPPAAKPAGGTPPKPSASEPQAKPENP